MSCSIGSYVNGATDTAFNRLSGLAPISGFPVLGSTLAAIAVQIGSSSFQASIEPPGISDGPKRAPSSPPETPEPINCNPRSVRAFSLRMVSSHLALPPSMIISSLSSNGIRASITASVALPA